MGAAAAATTTTTTPTAEELKKRGQADVEGAKRTGAKSGGKTTEVDRSPRSDLGGDEGEE
jgi:hypothetical protein